MRHATAVALLLGTIGTVTPAAPPQPLAVTGPIVHEWGTFTSIAGDDGRAVEWLPQAGPSDLPAFVYASRFGPKALLRGTVRMETPVIYFYAGSEMTVNVTARFRNGAITEWYPQATVTPSAADSHGLARPGFEGAVRWRDVTVVPRGGTEFPVEDRPSHYYAARETDASMLEKGGQLEKFLFYRGVGSFAPPISARWSRDGSVLIDHLFHEPLGSVILFENRANAIRYEVRHIATRSATFAPGLPAGECDQLFSEIESILVAHGLYPREAKAMIATWKDSWFEEGTRLFYVVPRETIDAILPLDVDPAPAAVARVFVGRVELITSDTLDAVRDAVARKDDVALQKYGRFLHHILRRLPDRQDASSY